MEEPHQPSIALETSRAVDDITIPPSSTLIAPVRLDRPAASMERTDCDLLSTQVLSTTTVLPTIEQHTTANIFTPGSRARNRSKSKEATFHDHLIDPPQPANPPRLIQGSMSLITYHKNACTAFASLPKDCHITIEFIRQFINGIQEPKTRNELVDELQKIHPCRTSRGGNVEILCEWADVAEGLSKLGMLPIESVEGATQDQRVTRKKKKILIPREFIESGMMR